MTEQERLKAELQKAQYDADYWRNKYDLLLKNIESQQSYINYIESQIFGGKTY